MNDKTKRVPVEPTNDELANRLDELVAVLTGSRDFGEFSMRIPADPKRDADLVMSEAARRLRAAPAPDDELQAKLEKQE